MDEPAVDAVHKTDGQIVENLPQSKRTTPGDLRRLAALLRDLASRQDIDEALQYAVDLARQVIPGCDVADIMFIRPGGTTTPVSTHELAQVLDAAQEDTDQGPCLTAAREERVVVVDDLADDQRWPEFAERAVKMGIRSGLSYQLYLRRNADDRFGALNLYGRTPGAFDDDAAAVGEIFAAHCSTVLAAAIAQEGLRAALESRDVIGQAKGVLMARHKITAPEAFEMLAATSQERNLKLRDLAERVSATGGLD